MHPTSCSGSRGFRHSPAMKRHPALVLLSRNHHHVLGLSPSNFAGATTETATEISGVFLAAWEAGGGKSSTSASRRSFYYLPTRRTATLAIPVVMRMLQDHMLIRRDAARGSRSDPSLELLHDLGSRLARRSRPPGEERELFPLIEGDHSSESELQALGERLTGRTRAERRWSRLNPAADPSTRFGNEHLGRPRLTARRA